MPAARLRTAGIALAPYLAAAVLSTGIVVGELRLWRADLAVPMNYSNDSLPALALTKGMLENGWLLRNPRLGAPGELELFDYPVPDNLHLLLMKGLGSFVADPVVVYNLFYLLTYPLAALAAVFVLRHFGASSAVAVVGGVLFALLPFHHQRFESGHYFIAAYHLVPLSVMVVLWVCLGRLPFFRGDGPGERRFSLWDRRTLAAVLVCVLTASAGAYYAFFACFFLVVAGAATALRELRPAGLVSGALLAGLITGGVVANGLPSLLYQAKHGANPDACERPSEHAETYGLKVAQLLLPSPDHRCTGFAKVRAAYRSPDRPLVNENEMCAVGLVAGSGFVLLLGALLVRPDGGRLAPRVGTDSRSESATWELFDGLRTLNVFGVLLGTVGGLGALFNFAAYSQIRCYNRIAVYLAFFGLLAALLLVDRLLRRRRAAVGYALCAALLALGVWDQTTDKAVPPYARLNEEFRQDAEFVARVEEALPPGSMVFQLPYVRFPELTFRHQMGEYVHLRTYLHSRSLRWSYGAMVGRVADAWQKQVAERRPGELVRFLALAGFRGVTVDRNGYPERAGDLEAELNELLGPPAVVSADGGRSFYDLTGYAEALRRKHDPAEWEAMAHGARELPCLLWRKGFFGGRDALSPEPRGCRSRGEAVLVNPAAFPKAMKLSMLCRPDAPVPLLLRIDSELFARQEVIHPAAGPIEIDFTLPPGEHRVRFACDMPKAIVPVHPGQVFSVGNVVLREVPAESNPAKWAEPVAGASELAGRPEPRRGGR